MKRLNTININNPELTEKIFKERWREQVHYIDWERFKNLTKYFKGGTYLDIGCFNSPMPFELTQKFSGSKIMAVDHSPYVIQKMHERFPEVHYMCGDLFKIGLASKSIDYIVAGEILEHMEEPESLIKECMRMLKSTGYLALSTPANEGSAGYSDEHLWSFSQEDLSNLLNQYGLVEIKEEEGNFPLFYAWCQKK